MKLLLLKIKFFFSQNQVILFFRVLFISAAVVALISYYAYPYITWIFEYEDRATIRQQMLEISEMSRSTNQNIIFDDTYLIENKHYQNTNQKQFWYGDALYYRYTEPQSGKP